jgi:hypothetical protein
MFNNPNYDPKMCSSNPVPSTPSPMLEPMDRRCITNDLTAIDYALNEMNNISQIILSKIDGGACNGTSAQEKEPVCISDKLELMKAKAERIFMRLDQINSFI